MVRKKNVDDKHKENLGKMGKVPTFEYMFKRGESTVKLGELFSIDTTNEQEVIKKVMRPLIKDKVHLDLMSRPENVDKYSRSFEYEFKCLDRDGKELGKFVYQGENMMNKVVNDMKMNLNYGMDIGEFSEAIEVLGQNGFYYEKVSPGRLATVIGTLTFIKG